MKKFLFILFLFLISCGKEMSNDEIIKEIKKCKDAGLSHSEYENYDGTVRLIRCTDKGR